MAHRPGAAPQSLLLACLLAVTALAGCAGSDGDGTTSPEPTGGTTLPPGSKGGPEAPVWALYDHWTYTTSAGEEITAVVIEETGTDWIIGTDSADVAFFDALTDISTQGPQRKADLAGSQGDDRVAFFRWPLADGANWTTRWDGVDRRVQVRDEGNGIWGFTATGSDNVTVQYTYDEEARWFGALEFFGPDGALTFGYELAGFGSGWTGEIARWTLDEVLAFAEESTLAYSTQPTSFEVPGGATDVWASFTIACTQGAVAIGVHPVPWDGGAVGRRWTEPCDGLWQFEGSLGHAAGTWNVDFVWHDTTQGAVTGMLYVRTLERVPIP